MSRKADKAYTKRKMALLVSRVSALLKEESDEPSMAKKCLSCDRAFNKLSIKDLELVQQVRTSQTRRHLGLGRETRAENVGVKYQNMRQHTIVFTSPCP